MSTTLKLIVTLTIACVVFCQNAYNYEAVSGCCLAAENDLVTIYRGVGADHPGLADALEGRAVPRGMGGGHTNPDFHNAGNTVSEFTSWSTRQSVADEFATAGGPGGVTLQLQVPRSLLINTVDAAGESEVLLRGPVQGAKVLQPLPENLPSWFPR